VVIANQQPADLGQLKEHGAKEIATTLTALERFMRQCIHPADYIAYSKNIDGPGVMRVADLHRLADGIKHWVVREVLRSSRVAQRGKDLKLFLDVAEVSYGGAPSLHALATVLTDHSLEIGMLASSEFRNSHDHFACSQLGHSRSSTRDIRSAQCQRIGATGEVNPPCSVTPEEWEAF
jgi:hypothetical protein